MCRACRWSMPTIALSVSSPGTTCCARSVVCRALQAIAVESAFRRDPDQAGHTSAAAIAPVRKEATGIAYGAVFAAMDLERSEEHTSELQSLMRISYAVFCLKKKNNNTITTKKQPHENTPL